MRYTSKLGFTLVELLVVIAIIGTLVGLLLPAVQAARESARSNTCKNNLVQLQKALSQRESSLGDFPGYINNLGVKGTQNQIRASWVVYTFPYLEQNALWDRWKQPDGGNVDSVIDPSGINIPTLELLICPSDPPVTPGLPNLSYAANAGWIQNSNSEIPSGGRENPANGVFFDRSRVLNPSNPNLNPNLVGPDDHFDTAQPLPLSMTMAYIQQKGDGTSSTILLTENVHQVFWAFRNRLDYASSAPSADEKYHFGVCWEQPDVVVDRSATLDEKARLMNGDTNEDPYEKIVDITLEDDGSAGALRRAAPSSRHPAGVNIAFVGGSVRFVGDQIEPRVFSQLMTSNRNRSDLVFSGQTESQMAPLSDADY